MSDKIWDNDLLQFARMLAEIRSIGLKSSQYDDLMASMNLSQVEIDTILNRAEAIFEREKARLFSSKKTPK